MDEQYFVMQITDESRPIAAYLDPQMGPSAITGDYLVIGFPEAGRVSVLRQKIFERHFVPSHGPMIELESYSKMELPTEPNPKFRKIDG